MNFKLNDYRKVWNIIVIYIIVVVMYIILSYILYM